MAERISGDASLLAPIMKQNNNIQRSDGKRLAVNKPDKTVETKERWYLPSQARTWARTNAQTTTEANDGIVDFASAEVAGPHIRKKTAIVDGVQVVQTRMKKFVVDFTYLGSLTCRHNGAHKYIKARLGKSPLCFLPNFRPFGSPSSIP